MPGEEQGRLGERRAGGGVNPDVEKTENSGF